MCVGAILRYDVIVEKPGILGPDGQVRDLSGAVPDIAGECLLPATLASVDNIEFGRLPVVRYTNRIGGLANSQNRQMYNTPVPIAAKAAIAAREPILGTSLMPRRTILGSAFIRQRSRSQF